MKTLLDNKTKLRFNKNGKFKIVVMSDLHAKIGGLSAEQQGYIHTILDKENPDLVIFAGDNVRSYGDIRLPDKAAFCTVLDSIANCLEERNLYWMHVFGNHDREEHPLSLTQQMEIYTSYPHCLSKSGPEKLTGVGNYLLPIYCSDAMNDDIRFAVWGIDSGNLLSEQDKQELFSEKISAINGCPGTAYDYIHHDQIAWYEKTSEQLEAYADHKVAGLMVFHIPLQEFNTAWLNRKSLIHTGEKNENVCACPHNSGLYDVMRYRGDIKAVVCGHDHINSFMVQYGGIKLCYCPTTSTNSYHKEDEMGARVFVLSEENPEKIETYISYL